VRRRDECAHSGLGGGAGRPPQAGARGFTRAKPGDLAEILETLVTLVTLETLETLETLVTLGRAHREGESYSL